MLEPEPVHLLQVTICHCIILWYNRLENVKPSNVSNKEYII